MPSCNNIPCTPVNVDSAIKNIFKAHATPQKELLGQALLIVVTFMDLFVYKNSSTWSGLLDRIKKSSQKFERFIVLREFPQNQGD